MTMSMSFPIFDVRKMIMRLLLVAFLTVGALQVTQCGGNTRDSYDDHASTAGTAEDTFR